MAALSIPEQDRLIRAAWPNFKTIVATKRLGIWRGTIRGLSHPYEIEIIYVRNGDADPFYYGYAPFPEVTVLDPPLTRRSEDPDDPIPHIYDDPDSAQPILCLFDPRVGGWRPHQAIAETILVWTASWLRFYEAWHATGVWTGGGAPHGPMTRPAVAVNDEGSPPDTVPKVPSNRRRKLFDHACHDALLYAARWREQQFSVAA